MNQQFGPPSCQQARGFTLLELIIVIVLVMILFLTVWTRLMPLRGDAEAAHVASVVGTLRSALGLETVDRITSDGIEALASLNAIDPMILLQTKPDNYLGSSRQALPGHWFFDEDSRQLRYRIRYPQYLENKPNGPVDLAWKVQVELHKERPGSVRLRALQNVVWPGESRPIEALQARSDASDRQDTPVSSS